MKYTMHKANLYKAETQRTCAYGIAIILLISNVLLCIKVFNQDEKWVLIPQFDIADRLAVHGDNYSNEYLHYWAGGLTQTLLTANPNTIDRVIQKFLEISSTQYGQVKPNIEAYGKDIKENNISTTFYAKDFKINREAKEVEVTGTFQTWFGRDKPPVIQTKTLIVGWSIGPKGVLLVSKFEERKDK